MYVGRRYTATHTQAFKKKYRCKACGFADEARVLGVGLGQGHSPYFLDNSQASMRAELGAQEDSAKNAELMLQLCPCPKCGARDSSRFIAQSILTLIGSALSLWMLGGILAVLKGELNPGLLWIFGLIGLFTPVLIYFTSIRSKWLAAPRHVFFASLANPSLEREAL